MIKLSFKKIIYLFVLHVLFTPLDGFSAPNFDQWLTQFKEEAQEKGITQKTIEAALTNIKPIPRVIELDRSQPEGRLTFTQYKKRVINQNRIDKGRRLYRKHKKELEKASKNYGVPGHVIVALWGIETSYGNNTGGFGVIPSLATLAYDGRRSDFFRSELLKALKILDEGHISPKAMRGSWAGAMGQNQFMPSSFHAYAIDGNNDGRRDIWTTLPDVFASTANYLSQNGWTADERWGRKVKIPPTITKSQTGLKIKKSLQQWKNLGITRPNGSPIPVVAGMEASLVTPDGLNGPAYLVYDNYRTIMKWNRSTYFATSVGLLADLIAKQ